jgi:tRNA nucleotidyltransferase/poly(A) polymerase
MPGSTDIDPARLGEQVESLAAIDQLRQIADRVPAYLVGGVVRDLLLGREVADLDVAIEEDAGALTECRDSASSGRDCS